ncbi:MAG TPA: sigma 54-interacting transcriptional regulator [Kofleriaceae bacterium]|nr:sigma 54-interacting transcriptional regulator [Kofleriaceae bacterium]
MKPDVTLETATWEATSHQGRLTVHLRCVRLEVVSGPDAGAGQQFSQPIVRVGTHRSCDLVLTDRRVSRFQCEISLEERGYRVRDLGSTNGTFVAGLRIADAFVPPGSKIKVGQSELFLVPLGTSVAVELEEMDRFGGLVGGSVPMRRLYPAIRKLAPTDTTVLITGETGVGKELVADAIHEGSARRAAPLVVVDCGAVPTHLFEDELFGHERGAFTGASAATAGAFERAHGGTLFLDEIGELPLELQPKLLRALESRRVRRIGGAEEIACDVRLMAATNRDLPVEVNKRTFRSDLYYRIAVAHLEVPPLRARREDIPALVEHFQSQLPAPARRPLPAELLARFARHEWPGNVRELRNAVEAASLSPDAETVPDTPDRGGADPLADFIDPDLPFREARRRLEDAFERRFLTALLERHDWNVSAVSRAARVDRMTIYKMLSRLGLSRPTD